MTKDWDGHRDTILKLYKEQNQPLKDVMRVMEEQYKFKVSCVFCVSARPFPPFVPFACPFRAVECTLSIVEC